MLGYILQGTIISASVGCLIGNTIILPRPVVRAVWWYTGLLSCHFVWSTPSQSDTRHYVSVTTDFSNLSFRAYRSTVCHYRWQFVTVHRLTFLFSLLCILPCCHKVLSEFIFIYLITSFRKRTDSVSVKNLLLNGYEEGV
jgi:hypothetical protein